MTQKTFILSGSTNDFTVYYPYPIILDPSKKYEAAFLSLETYNSIPNITAKNNIFKYSNDSGVSWKIISLDKDAYEINQINDEIQLQMIMNNDYDAANKTFHVNISVSRLSSAVEITNPNYKIDFGVDNSIGKILGFESVILSQGYHKSPNIIDIMNVNAILVNVDIISGSFVNETSTPAIHVFSPNVGPGYKIRERPQPELTYYEVNRSYIDSIRVWLTDKNKNLIDFQGERVTLRITIREQKNAKYYIKEAIKELKDENIL